MFYVPISICMIAQSEIKLLLSTPSRNLTNTLDRLHKHIDTYERPQPTHIHHVDLTNTPTLQRSLRKIELLMEIAVS